MPKTMQSTRKASATPIGPSNGKTTSIARIRIGETKRGSADIAVPPDLVLEDQLGDVLYRDHTRKISAAGIVFAAI
jgi:hypothetical protein